MSVFPLKDAIIDDFSSFIKRRVTFKIVPWAHIEAILSRIASAKKEKTCKIVLTWPEGKAKCHIADSHPCIISLILCFVDFINQICLSLRQVFYLFHYNADTGLKCFE